MKIKNKIMGGFTNNFWNEIKKINWKKVNKDSLKKFKIIFIGDNESLASLIHQLEKSTYDFLNLKTEKEIILTPSAEAKIVFVDINKISNFKTEIIYSNIVIVDNKYNIQEQEYIKRYYIFDSVEKGDIFEEILTDNQELWSALGFNYPVFRSTIARKKITEVATQNAFWAAGSSAANIIPGPQQLITAPLEAASDFTVLTTNELRMVFIIAGICGRIINPLKLLPELMIMGAGAKGAQLLATQTIGKVPVGAGNVLKATVAFAFTFAIGEAVFLKMNYGIKIDSKKIKERVKVLKEFSKKRFTKFIKK